MKSKHVKYGCLGCGTILALMAIATTALLIFVMTLVRSSDAYQQGVSLATKSEAVRSALGEPIDEGFFVTGSVNVNGAGGTADLSVPLEGSEAEGTLYVYATKRAGIWNFDELTLVLADERQIDVLAESR